MLCVLVVDLSRIRNGVAFLCEKLDSLSCCVVLMRRGCFVYMGFMVKKQFFFFNNLTFFTSLLLPNLDYMFYLGKKRSSIFSVASVKSESRTIHATLLEDSVLWAGRVLCFLCSLGSWFSWISSCLRYLFVIKNGIWSCFLMQGSMVFASLA